MDDEQPRLAWFTASKADDEAFLANHPLVERYQQRPMPVKLRVFRKLVKTPSDATSRA